MNFLSVNSFNNCYCLWTNTKCLLLFQIISYQRLSYFLKFKFQWIYNRRGLQNFFKDRKEDFHNRVIRKSKNNWTPLS